MQKLAIILVSLAMLSACSSASTDPAQIFEAAFEQAPPAGVEVLHGYRLERRRFFVISDSMWRLHLKGQGARPFVYERWPDLEAVTVRSFAQGMQTPWFAPGRDVQYVTLKSPTDAGVMVMLNPQSSDVYIAYDPS